MSEKMSIEAKMAECTQGVYAELAALCEHDDAYIENLTSSCEHILALCTEGLPLRFLQACAEVSDRGCLRISEHEMLFRSGPYPHYTRAFEQNCIDDYTLIGNALLVGAKGAISLRDGTLLVIPAHGRFSASDGFHVVRPKFEDFDYLRFVLSGIEAYRYAKGTNAAYVIELASLRGAIVPWPSSEYRCLFVQTLLQCEKINATALKKYLINAWVLTTHDMNNLDMKIPACEISNDKVFSESDLDEERGVLTVADDLLAAMSSSEGSVVDVVAETDSLANPGEMQRGDLCVCFPAPNQGAWTDHMVDEKDPRWVFGVPPRNKANFVWIQQTVACMKQDGCALMLLCDAVLHSNSGREATVRQAWATSGLIEAVISLPGGLFSDNRPPASFIIMRKNRSVQETLFIDALELGDDLGFKQNDAMARQLSPDNIKKIIGTYTAWKLCENYEDKPGFCKSVDIKEVINHDKVLTPWTYV